MTLIRLSQPRDSSYHLNVRTLKLLIVLMTLLTLPGYGLAGIAHTRSCQDEMSAAHHVVVAGDCCSGKLDQSSPCKRFGEGSPAGKKAPCSPCKAGYNCKSSQPAQPPLLSATLPVTHHRSMSVNPPTLPLSRNPDELWRPPSLV